MIMDTNEWQFEQILHPSSAFLEAYEKIPMLVHVKSELKLEKIDGGLGGVLFCEVPVESYTKDLGQYELPTEFSKKFDTTNWAFFAAFNRGTLVAAATVACKTKEIHMLDGRDDLCVLWDIRVDENDKQCGVGTRLLQMAVKWAKGRGFVQMKIECQNNNVPAVRFYRRAGGVLGAFDEYFYYNDLDSRQEVALIWYLNL